MRSAASLVAFFSFVAFFIPTPSIAQTVPPTAVPSRPLGPGDPLPPFHLKSRTVKSVVSREGNTITITGGVEFTMGDLRIRADRMSVSDGYQHIEATGHVALTRGDETLHGQSFVLDAGTATFTTDEATLLSAPLYVRAHRIVRGPDGTRAEDARIATGTTDGEGEFRLHAAYATIPPDNRTLHMRNVTISLYGVRLITLRRLTLNLQRHRHTAQENNRFSLPLIVRQSKLSGSAVGLTLPYTLTRNLYGRGTIVQTTQQGTEFVATLGHTLYSRDGPGTRQVFHLDQKPTDPDPLRALLKARPLPPPPDPVLDFTDITVTGDPLATPTRSTDTDLHVDLTVSRRQEYANQRQGPLLVSRSPQLTLSGRLPLTAIAISDDNAAARRALRVPRVALTGDTSVGEYEEDRLFGDRMTTRLRRLSVTGGLGTAPLLVGSRLLTRAQTTLHLYRYENGETYRFLETSANADYVFATRTALGVAYITRARNGTTPFYFDQVDTQDEGQLRGDISLGPKHRYSVAVVGRYDINQRRFFDYEFAGSLRGRNIEPRLSYRYLNRQYNFAVSFPGLTSP